jgi:hypothetical protein
MLVSNKQDDIYISPEPAHVGWVLLGSCLAYPSTLKQGRHVSFQQARRYMHLSRACACGVGSVLSGSFSGYTVSSYMKANDSWIAGNVEGMGLSCFEVLSRLQGKNFACAQGESKVKLSLSLTSYALCHEYMRSGGIAPLFLIPILGRFTSSERVADTHWTRGWVVPRFAVVETNLVVSVEARNPIIQPVSKPTEL